VKRRYGTVRWWWWKGCEEHLYYYSQKFGAGRGRLFPFFFLKLTCNKLARVRTGIIEGHARRFRISPLGTRGEREDGQNSVFQPPAEVNE